MCLSKSGESGKDCKGVISQKGKRPPVTALHASSLYFTRSEIGSQWSYCRRGVQF